MTRLFSKGQGILLTVFLLCALACSTLTKAPSAVTPSPSPSSSDTPPGELTLQQNIVFGSGAFIYTDTRAGLADLSSYQATLTLAFDGTKDGQAHKWSQTYVMTATKDPAVRQWTIEEAGDSSNPGSVFMAEMEGMDYQRQGEGSCSATAIREGDSLGDRLEPASFLTGVIGAEAASSETVNGVEANHYTFDQRALGEEGLTQSTGELWVATQGGYLVKYLRTTRANADYFGEGIEGTLTLDYELTDVNKETTIELPADCPPGLVEAPELPDATNIDNSAGMLSYDTATSLKDAVAFYQDQLPGLGWKPQGDPSLTDTLANLNYIQEKKSMHIIIKSGEAGTQVLVLISDLTENEIP